VCERVSLHCPAASRRRRGNVAFYCCQCIVRLTIIIIVNFIVYIYPIDIRSSFVIDQSVRVTHVHVAYVRRNYVAGLSTGILSCQITQIWHFEAIWQ